MQNKVIWMILAVVCLCGTPGFAAGTDTRLNEYNYGEFQKLLDTTCSKCHTRGRIEQAMTNQKNVEEIQERMIQHGAELNKRDKEILGVFWPKEEKNRQQPKTVSRPIQEDPLAEYRAVLQARCTGCHTLERVEKAMQEGKSIEHLAEMMLKRGAVITRADRDVLGVFWGKPLNK